MSGPSVLIAGGGIVGRSVAYYLTSGGARVRLVDPEPDPSATTRASLGVLTHFNGGDGHYSRLYRDGKQLHIELAPRLLEETGIDVGFRRPGGIDLVLADEELPQAHDLMAFKRERGCECEWLDAGRLRREEPHVSARAVGGVLFADDHQVNPEVLAEALLKAARSRGLEISFGTRLGSFERVRDDGVRVRLETASSSAVEVCDVDFVVLAAGAWSGPLGQLSGADPFIRAVGGQHCRFGGGRRLRHILRHGGYCAVPLGEQILAGATLEEEGYAMETTAAAREEITTSFRRMLALTPELLEQRAGLRPKPRQGRPVIGPLGSEASRVFVASGHYKNGVLLGPITGDLIARWVLSGQPPRQMGAFAVRR